MNVQKRMVQLFFPSHYCRKDPIELCVGSLALTLKGLSIEKWILIFLAPAQRNWMQPILLSYEAPFRTSVFFANCSLTVIRMSLWDWLHSISLSGGDSLRLGEGAYTLSHSCLPRFFQFTKIVIVIVIIIVGSLTPSKLGLSNRMKGRLYLSISYEGKCLG